MSRRVRRALYAVAPLVIVAVGAELGLRAADWPSAAPGAFTHAAVYWVEPGAQHLEPHPHREVGGSFRVSTDPNGLRAPIHPETKPDGVTRVATLGCSTTFGWGVDDDASYPARLESMLVAEGRPVEVINGAQPGHTTFQGLWLWDEVLHRYAPDVVVLGYVVQDARKVAYSDRSQAALQRDAAFLKQNVLYRVQSYVALRAIVDGWRIRAKELPDGETEGGVHRVPPDEYADNLRAFKQRTDAIGARLVLFGFPLEREGYTAEHRRALHAVGAELGVPVLDPQPEFERVSAQETLYFPQDRGHANAAGLERVARTVAEFLKAEGLVR